jgi:hypothetical protein
VTTRPWRLSSTNCECPESTCQARNRLRIIASHESKNEVSMYNPFVLACNYALGALSEIDVHGLPEFTKEKQLDFVRDHDRVVLSKDLKRASRTKPDIVLLQ